MFFVVIEVLFVVVLGLIGITQILIPTLNETPWFPILRKREKLKELKKANEEIEDGKLDIDIELARLQAKSLRESLSASKGEKE